MNENDRLAFMMGRGVAGAGRTATDWLAPLVSALLGEPQDMSSLLPTTGPNNIFDRAAGLIPQKSNYMGLTYPGLSGGTIANSGMPTVRSNPDLAFNAEVGGLPTSPRKTMGMRPSMAEPPRTMPRGPYTAPNMRLTVPPGSSYTGAPSNTGNPPQPLVGYGTEAEGHTGIGPVQTVRYPGGALGGGEEYYGMQERWAPEVMGK